MDKPNAHMPPAPTAPEIAPPKGAWDAHVHLVGGKDDFPLWEGRVEDPAQDGSGGPDFDGWLDLYRAHLDALGFDKGLIVHSILYGTDNSVTVETLKRLGPSFRGVGLLPDDATDADLDRFADQNLCAVRLNYVHGGVLSWEGAKAMAPRLADKGLHIQMLLHADLHITELADDIRALPVPLVIDHCGWPTTRAPDTRAIDTLCALLAEGHVYVKLSAPYRLTRTIAEAQPLMRKLIDANPDHILWGSDWPHIMLGDAHMPRTADLAGIVSDITTAAERRKIFVTTPDSLFAP